MDVREWQIFPCWSKQDSSRIDFNGIPQKDVFPRYRLFRDDLHHVLLKDVSEDNGIHRTRRVDWIIENLLGAWTVCGVNFIADKRGYFHRFSFELESDAMMFKLFFG